MTTDNAWYGVQFKVRQHTKQRKPTGMWVVQFYRRNERGVLWKLGKLKGGFMSRHEAVSWVAAMRRLGEQPWV